MNRGYLYVANRQKFLDEAIISVQSLKRFNAEPVCIVLAPNLRTREIEEIFDVVVEVQDFSDYTYLAKVIGLQATPFERTVFLDGDTFVTDTISELFELLDLVDFATTLEQKLHTTNYKNLKYQKIFPEFNSGVIVYRSSPIMKKTLEDWFEWCTKNQVINDMPGLREAVLMNFDSIRFSILPNCYNEHGFSTMLVLDQKVKVIHERLGYKKGVVTPHFLDFKSMDKFARKINKIEHKRLFIPKLGVISYRWSPTNLILFMKKKLGHKKVSKSR